ncbi:MAG: Fe-S cluster assembly protein SufD, partial [Alphaproteobacteria bacterium]|nr:Fe-S cluster assembly protein SufD [Alphaproteobacteria bacterium]
MSATFAIDLTDAATFPSRRDEAWKYSDLKRHLREAPTPSGTAAVGAPGPFYALGGEAIVFA